MENKQITLEQLSDIYGFRVVVDDHRRLLSRARRRAYGLARGAGPLQGLHLDAQAEQLPVDPHHHRRPAPPARRAADPHPRDARHRRIRRCRARALQGRQCASTATAAGAKTPARCRRTTPYIWLRRLVETLLEGDNPEEFLEHTKLELFQDQVFCFTPKGRLIALAARRHADRFRLCRAHRHRQRRRRRLRQRPASAARHAAAATATRSRS